MRCCRRFNGAARPEIDATEPSAERLPRGRHGLPAGVVTRSQRRRILIGTAEVMVEKGYASATVADIVAAAGISRDVFYEHFADKQHAFLEAQQYGPPSTSSRRAPSRTSRAGVAGERVERAPTLVGLIAANPATSHLRIVECYADGAGGDPQHRGDPAGRGHLPRGRLQLPTGGSGAASPVLRCDHRRGLRGDLPSRRTRRRRRAS